MKHFVVAGLCLFAAAGNVRAEEVTTGGYQTEGWGWDPSDWDIPGKVGGGLDKVGRSIGDAGRDIGQSLQGMDPASAVNTAAMRLAGEFHSDHPNANFDDCVLFTAGAMAAAGSYAGPAGAFLGGAAGVAAARIACRAWYP